MYEVHRHMCVDEGLVTWGKYLLPTYCVPVHAVPDVPKYLLGLPTYIPTYLHTYIHISSYLLYPCRFPPILYEHPSASSTITSLQQSSCMEALCFGYLDT